MVVPKLVGVNDGISDMLVTVRCVIAATTDGEVRFDVPTIAERTGLTVNQVRSVLESPAYQELFANEARQLVAHTLVRGVRSLEAIISGTGKTKDSDKIAAHRAIVQTYMALSAKGETPSSPEGEFDKMMAHFKSNRLKVEESNASARGTPPGTSSGQEGSD